MSSIEQSGREYARSAWSQLEAGPSTDIVMPPQGPGMELSLHPLSDFDQLTGAAEFVEEFKLAPHAVINLGHGALLGMVEDVRESGALPGLLQRVVVLGGNAHRELSRDEVPEYGVGLGKGWIGRENKQGYPTQDEVHGRPLTLYSVGMKWLLRSNPSNVSGEVATQIAPQPGTLYVPERWADLTD